MRNLNPSTVHSFIPAGRAKHLHGFDVEKYEKQYGDVRYAFDALSKIGINMDTASIGKMMATMDAVQPTVTTGSISTPVQFLQQWLPGFVYVITGARRIDDFIGMMTVGAWEDEQIVQSLLELTGYAQPYGDYTNVPLSSWNVNFNLATVVRFEEGMQVGILESARASRIQIDSGNEKRQSGALSLEIARNNVGFFGYNSGANNTYGFLNAPGLPAYVTVPVGAGGFTTWSTKTFLEIQRDILFMVQQLRTQSQSQIDPGRTNMVLALATAVREQIEKSTDFNVSIVDWLNKTYGNRVRIEDAPQLNAANGGANVAYMYAERMDGQDMSTDGGAIWLQMVPSKFKVLGVQQNPKNYVEDYSNATAGVMLKRPFGVVRISGV